MLGPTNLGRLQKRPKLGLVEDELALIGELTAGEITGVANSISELASAGYGVLAMSEF